MSISSNCGFLVVAPTFPESPVPECFFSSASSLCLLERNFPPQLERLFCVDKKYVVFLRFRNLVAGANVPSSLTTQVYSLFGQQEETVPSSPSKYPCSLYSCHRPRKNFSSLLAAEEEPYPPPPKNLISPKPLTWCWTLHKGLRVPGRA